MIPGGFGPNELIMILIVVFLLFGATKIPQLARSVGKGMGEFKKAQKQSEMELKEFEQEIKDGKYKGNKTENIEKMASDLGIDTEDKSEEELLEEINKVMPKKKSS
ncbi:MAG: twin-arginine translocase TatA/TatE family subunit [Archaeoglobaceae archaeon]